MLRRLRASHLDNSHDAEVRGCRVELLILDAFALQPPRRVDTADVYELIVERHRSAATVVTSNREPVEWLGPMVDPLLALSASDRNPLLISWCLKVSPTGVAGSPVSALLTRPDSPRDHHVADADRA